MKQISFAVNQIILPDSPFENFISFVQKLNIDAIEIRNDIKTNLLYITILIKLKIKTNICKNLIMHN